MISRHLRSGCCGAPVRQSYDFASCTFPIRCTRCGRLLATPGHEDVPNAENRAMSMRLLTEVGT